jgi:hypothetical protein
MHKKAKQKDTQVLSLALMMGAVRTSETLVYFNETSSYPPL